jgi:hypothetical protein
MDGAYRMAPHAAVPEAAAVATIRKTAKLRPWKIALLDTRFFLQAPFILGGNLYFTGQQIAFTAQ